MWGEGACKVLTVGTHEGEGCESEGEGEGEREDSEMYLVLDVHLATLLVLLLAAQCIVHAEVVGVPSRFGEWW